VIGRAAGALIALAGCYTGSARTVTPAAIDADPGWVRVRGVPFVAQRGESDCGVAALAMVLRYWGVVMSMEAKGPLTAGELRDVARGRGLQAFVVKGDPTDIRDQLARGRPLIVGLGKRYGRSALAHFEVLVGYHPAGRFLTLDPAAGWRVNTAEGFAAEWAASEQLVLIVVPAAP
jgi:ABC-type bacteriocin/lantibiotic exporter with double-glycine peptidase domain